MKAIHTIKDWFVLSNKAERVWLMAKIEFRLKYLENKLGSLWAIIKPLNLLLLYYIVFDVIMKSGVENYTIYLFLGIVLWLYFTEVTSGTIKILQTKRYLYEYTNMKKFEIYLASVLSSVIGLIINLMVFFIVSLFFNLPFSLESFVWFPVIVFNLVLLSFGISLILSNLFLLFKDIAQVWGIVISFLFFFSPILYRSDRFKEALPGLEYANPIAGIIDNSRAIVIYASKPDWFMLVYDLAYAGILLLVGLLMLKKISVGASEKL